MNEIKLELCNDITCFTKHFSCPKCYGFLHISEKSNIDFSIKLSTCTDISCFDPSHKLCPDCYRVIHVDKLYKLT